MVRSLVLVPALFFAFAPAAIAVGGTDETEVMQPAGTSELGDFLWHNRPIIVFADSPEDPRFVEQMRNLNDGLKQLEDRDVIVLTDTDPAARTPLRQKLRPRGFMLVLVAKDGTIMLRKPLPWTVRELTRSIDKLPTRKREVEERRQPR